MQDNRKMDISDDRRKTPTLLVVDDNKINLKVIALTLRSLNYNLVIATDGKSAIEMVKKTNPDLVLLDVMMPDMNGYEVCKILKSDKANENLPVIFLTALDDKENLVKGFDAGGVDYITKPFNKSELISRVKTHLELKYTQDQLKKTSQHLSELNLLKDKMFSIIGHDLRSPLGSVKMTLEFLSQMMGDDTDEELKSTVDLLVVSTEEVFSLLENLMAWAKSQSDILDIHFEELNLSEVVNSVYLTNNGLINNKNLSFTSDIPEDLKISADLYTLKIIFRNLLINAVKYTPEKGEIAIRAHQSDEGIVVEFADKGVGIAEENIPKLFDETVNFTTYGTNGESGRGLGLILCNDFAQRNGGKIWVESEEGKGSVFSVLLKPASTLD